MLLALHKARGAWNRYARGYTRNISLVRPDSHGRVAYEEQKGGRVGFGRGYYDRLLAFARSDAVKVGLAYDFQIVDDVYSEDYDIMMDYIITDKEIIRTREL